LLVIYDVETNLVISLSGALTYPPSRAEVLAISLAEPLPEGQAEYRIFNFDHISLVWEAHENNRVLSVILDDNQNPIGIKADDEILFIDEN
jgi:hypothetical protein